MHRVDNSRFLLYIEPKAEQKSKAPINDEITKTVQECLNRAKIGAADYSDLEGDGNFIAGDSWRGFHNTACGERSESNDYLLENGMITNNLCVFYLQYYRKAIPESEMQKVIRLCLWANGT